MRRNPLCGVDNYHAVLDITQGDISVGILGQRGTSEIDGTAAYVFPAPASGLVVGANATLMATVYFQCVHDLYGVPKFKPSNANFSREFSSRLVYSASHLVSKKKPSADGASGMLQPAPFNKKTLEWEVPISSLVYSTLKPMPRPRSVEWIHLVGDSIMRANYLRLCALCPTAPSGTELLALIEGDRRHRSTFHCPEHNLIIHYDFGRLDLMPALRHVGAQLSDFAEPNSPGASVSKAARITLASLGSHTPHYPIDVNRDRVPKFISTLHERTGGRLAILLTTAVCIDKIPDHVMYRHGTPEILVRNNYRMRAFNTIIFDTAVHLRISLVDLFSMTLSIGCEYFVDAVHLDVRIRASIMKVVTSAWLPWMLQET